MLRIGVLDSGVGGLTTVQALFALRADIEVVYVADNAQGAYGSKTEAQIRAGTQAMLYFLAAQKVDVIAVACNTISSTLTLAEYTRYEQQYQCPIISIIDPMVAQLQARPTNTTLGLIATPFTIANGRYAQQLQQIGLEVAGVASAHLASWVEQASVHPNASVATKIDTAIQHALMHLYAQSPALDSIILGCTHYPFVQDRFEALAPKVSFLNPAQAHAESVLAHLPLRAAFRLDANTRSQQKALSAQPTLWLSTSGDTQAYVVFARQLGLPACVAIEAGAEFMPRKGFDAVG